MYLLVFLCFTYEALGNEVLFDSSFTSNSFTTSEGWNEFQRQGVSFNIGAYQSQNYFGLNTFVGSFLHNDGISKMFYSLPPHYAIRVKGTTLIKITGIYAQNMGGVLIDGKISITKFMRSYYQDPNNPQMYLKGEFDVTELHYATSALIQLEFGNSNEGYNVTFGLRDFYFYIQKCPSGCESCDNAIACNSWKLQYRSLTNQQFSTFDTEGWQISTKFNNLDTNTYMSLENCIGKSFDTVYFGFGLLNQQITKTIELPLHYKVKISYHQLLYTINPKFSYNWVMEIDGQIITTKTFGYIFGTPPHLCIYVYPPVSINEGQTGEIYDQINFESSHTKQFLNYATYPTNYIFSDSLIKWAIRDFEVYIKKCHASCLYSCKGPGPQDCVDDVLYKLFQFYSVFTETTFTNNDGWQMIKATPLSILRCMDSLVAVGTKFFQGSNYFQKIYYLTQTHTSVSISFTLYQIDKFTGEKLFVLVDDVEVKQVSLLPVTIDDGLPFCGVDTDYDKRIVVNVTGIAHSQKVLIVQLYTNQIASATGSWGIRNFVLTIDRKQMPTEFTNLNLDSNDYKDWVFTPTTFQLSLCSSKTLFGGTSSLDENSSLRKIIKNIPEHEKIKIEFKIVLKVVSDKNIQLAFDIDGTRVFEKYLQTKTLLYCDASTNSNFYSIEEIYDHKNSEVFLLISTSNSVGLMWGIRDFKLSYYQRQIYTG
ncbi:unnamed protein product [Paramecium octaurelia]|uniref:Uncharacterized protein n=1 Tax=Paramecium octaurelia TaxID=43137 RepID=A0A8S1UKY9_PAROT|nr:unnamed protein product [Paramecium octaurelia]